MEGISSGLEHSVELARAQLERDSGVGGKTLKKRKKKHKGKKEEKPKIKTKKQRK